MALNLKLPEIPKLPKLKKGKVPSKTYINVLVKRKQAFSLEKRLPVIIIVVIIAAILCKFTVVDRFTSVMTESGRLSRLQEELNVTKEQIGSLEDVDDLYAHYTTSGMTEEELSRVDRTKAMKLIDKAFLHGNKSKSWNLTGNVMTLEVVGPSLRELNELAEQLEENPIVERCVISSANKKIAESSDVAVTFVIYLKQPDKE